MKILLVSNLLPPEAYGGYEMRAYEIGLLLRRRGHKVDFVTSQFTNLFKDSQKISPGINRIFKYILPSQCKDWRRFFDRFYNRIQCSMIGLYNYQIFSSFLDGKNYDVAYFFNLERCGLLTALAVQEKGIPTVFHLGDNYIAKHLSNWPGLSPWYQWFHNFFLSRLVKKECLIQFNNVFYVSRFLQLDCEKKGFLPRRSHVVPRPVTCEFNYSTYNPEDPPFFFMSCRIDKQKGVHVAIKAARKLHQEHPDMKWKIVLSGQSHDGYLQKCLKMAEDYGIKDRVSYIGFLQRSTVLEHMKKCVAFINTPTYGEPFAGTILEAMSSGAPLLTSDNGSSLEVVSHEINALVHTGQDYSSLARNMKRIITHKDFASLISRNAINHVSSHFNKDQIMTKTIDLLTNVAYEK
jgi:glycosyltransferase involved in cell wall biosynthesis